MAPVHSYHFRRQSLLKLAKLAGSGVLWALLFAISSRLAFWEAALMTTTVSLLSALMLRDALNTRRAGCWISDTHFHVYHGDDRVSVPLQQIVAVHGQTRWGGAQTGQIETISGHMLPIATSALPPAAQLQHWFDTNKATHR